MAVLRPECSRVSDHRQERHLFSILAGLDILIRALRRGANGCGQECARSTPGHARTDCHRRLRFLESTLVSSSRLPAFAVITLSPSVPGSARKCALPHPPVQSEFPVPFLAGSDILVPFPRRRAHGCGQKCPRSTPGRARTDCHRRLRFLESTLVSSSRLPAFAVITLSPSVPGSARRCALPDPPVQSEFAVPYLAGSDIFVAFPRRRAHGCGQKCPRSANNLAPCAGFSFSKRTHSAILAPAPEAGVARSTRAATPVPLSLFSSLTWRQDGAEPEVGVMARRVVVVAIRRPAVRRVAVPTAAPNHTEPT